MSLQNVLIALFAIGTTFSIAHIFIESSYRISVFEFTYILITGELPHFREKRKLVAGDFILIRYRGKYRKAFVVMTSSLENAAQLQFFDKELNVDLVKHNWYPLARIVLPEFMKGKAAKVLYSDLED